MKSPATPEAYIADLAEPRRSELTTLHEAIRKTAPQLECYLAYNGTMVGYGPYHYRYATGTEGDCPIVAISSRANYISLYVLGNRNGRTLAEEAADRLGKVSVGKACIRFKRLEDLKLDVAMELVVESSRLLTNGSTDFSLESSGSAPAPKPEPAATSRKSVKAPAKARGARRG